MAGARLMRRTASERKVVLEQHKRNLGYQTLYQVIMTALPIVTAPYLARVLGANQLGIYSYTLSVANYFVLFSLLGIENTAPAALRR